MQFKFKDTNRLKMKDRKRYSMKTVTKNELGWLDKCQTK